MAERWEVSCVTTKKGTGDAPPLQEGWEPFGVVGRALDFVIFCKRKVSEAEAKV